jgi:hypothetical protein
MFKALRKVYIPALIGCVGYAFAMVITAYHLASVLFTDIDKSFSNQPIFTILRLNAEDTLLASLPSRLTDRVDGADGFTKAMSFRELSSRIDVGRSEGAPIFFDLKQFNLQEEVSQSRPQLILEERLAAYAGSLLTQNDCMNEAHKLGRSARIMPPFGAIGFNRPLSACQRFLEEVGRSSNIKDLIDKVKRFQQWKETTFLSPYIVRFVIAQGNGEIITDLNDDGYHSVPSDLLTALKIDKSDCDEHLTCRNDDTLAVSVSSKAEVVKALPVSSRIDNREILDSFYYLWAQYRVIYPYKSLMVMYFLKSELISIKMPFDEQFILDLDEAKADAFIISENDANLDYFDVMTRLWLFKMNEGLIDFSGVKLTVLLVLMFSFVLFLFDTLMTASDKRGANSGLREEKERGEAND